MENVYDPKKPPIADFDRKCWDCHSMIKKGTEFAKCPDTVMQLKGKILFKASGSFCNFGCVCRYALRERSYELELQVHLIWSMHFDRFKTKNVPEGLKLMLHALKCQRDQEREQEQTQEQEQKQDHQMVEEKENDLVNKVGEEDDSSGGWSDDSDQGEKVPSHLSMRMRRDELRDVENTWIM